jgi:hypothetical protein
MYNRYDKAKEIEQEIIKYKNEQHDKIIRPVDAFITFQEEDGKIVAESLEAKTTFFGSYIEDENHPKLLNSYLHFKEASEPTNIIWENRHYDDAHYFKEGIKVLVLIACLLAASFMTIYYFKSDAIAQARKYPPIKANDVIRLYQTPASNDTDDSKMYLLYEHGKQEYEYLLETEKKNEKPYLNGFYQTFCLAYNKQ